MRQVVSDQWNCKDPSHCWKQPIAPKPTPISLYLELNNCCLLCCFCCCEQQHWSDLSRAETWVKYMEILGCPVIRIPLSVSPMWPKGGQSSTCGINLAAGAARRKLKLSIQLHRGPLLAFPQGLLLKPFPWLDVATRQWWFEIGVFLLLDWLPFQANELHLPKATGFEAPKTHLCPFFCQ